MTFSGRESADRQIDGVRLLGKDRDAADMLSLISARKVITAYHRHAGYALEAFRGPDTVHCTHALSRGGRLFDHILLAVDVRCVR